MYTTLSTLKYPTCFPPKVQRLNFPCKVTSLWSAWNTLISCERLLLWWYCGWLLNPAPVDAQCFTGIPIVTIWCRISIPFRVFPEHWLRWDSIWFFQFLANPANPKLPEHQYFLNFQSWRFNFWCDKCASPSKSRNVKTKICVWQTKKKTSGNGPTEPWIRYHSLKWLLLGLPPPAVKGLYQLWVVFHA
jgi:hypothetical protein